jgi:hypothetical protein
MPIRCHGFVDWLAILHIKPLEKILAVLFLRDESPFSHLLDLKPKEEGELANHRHLELF